MFTLPPEIQYNIYQLDPTYRRTQWQIVVHQLKTILALQCVFTHHLADLIMSPFYKSSILAHVRKRDLLQYAKTFGMKVFSRTTKSRLLTLMVWYHLNRKNVVDVFST